MQHEVTMPQDFAEPEYPNGFFLPEEEEEGLD